MKHANLICFTKVITFHKNNIKMGTQFKELNVCIVDVENVQKKS